MVGLQMKAYQTGKALFSPRQCNRLNLCPPPVLLFPTSRYRQLYYNAVARENPEVLRFIRDI